MNPSQRTGAPHGPRPGTTREREPEQYGGHAIHDQSDANDTRFVACPGKAEGRTEVGRPPAPQGPPAATPGRTAHRPRPPPRPPAPERPGRAGPPQGGHTTPSQARGERDRAAPPPQQTKQSTGPRQDTRRSTDRVERPYRRQAPGPREVRAPHRPRGGGGRRGSTRASTHKGHAGNTRRATRPSPRNAQTAWNGIPASEIRDTRTGWPETHSAGNAGREGGNGEDTKPGTGPSPPEPAASAAHTQPGHCNRQGRSGAPRHAPAPRLGNLRASPSGSNW